MDEDDQKRAVVFMTVMVCAAVVLTGVALWMISQIGPGSSL